MTVPVIMDRVIRTAAFGVRFRDVATDTFVSEGLEVSLCPDSEPSSRVLATAGPSGVFSVHLERKGSFTVEVVDLLSRFVPFKFKVQLPTQGLFSWVSPSGSPLAETSSVPIYSSATRPPLNAMAVIRADVHDAIQNQPASFAVMEAALDGRLVARGIADDRGRVALIFPYPAPVAFPASSPVTSPVGPRGPALRDQVWPLTISVKYYPQAVAPDAPDLWVILQQPLATAWADSSLTRPFSELPLRYGIESVLKSAVSSSSPPSRRSVLLVTPAVSPL